MWSISSIFFQRYISAYEVNTVFSCNLSVMVVTVNIQEIWICYSSHFIMKTPARVSGQSHHWCVLCCIISTRRALRGPLPNPPSSILRMHHLLTWPQCIAVPSTAVSHLGQHPPSQRIHCGARAAQSDRSGANAGWGTAGIFQDPSLLHFKSPPPPSLHKRNNGRLKRRRGGGGEESLFQEDSVFSPLVPKEGGGCMHREEEDGSVFNTCW